MALNNSQYNTIIRSYEEKQRRSREQLAQHKEIVYKTIPEYEALEQQVASVSIEKGRKLLSGDANALNELKQTLNSLTEKKASLLTEHGFPSDYLQPHFECAKCQDTGYVDNHKCNCFRKSEIDLIYEQSNIKNLLKTDNFSNLSYDYYAQEDLEHFQKAVQRCQTFIEQFDSVYQNLYFYGTVGTGKSFLSSCVAKELIDQGKLVIYFSSSQLFETLSKASFDRDSAEATSGIYEDIYECDLLIIDDLGTEITNAFVSSQLFACLNNRQLRRKPIIISTNLSMEELRNKYSDRIFSRIMSNFEVCKLTGRDIRMVKKMSSKK